MSSRGLLVIVLGACLGLPASLRAEVTRRDAIEAQTASALASAEYAQRHCGSLRVDQGIIEKNLKAIGGTLADLRKTESYQEQLAALQSVEKRQGEAMVCLVLPNAHGGYGRGVIAR